MSKAYKLGYAGLNDVGISVSGDLLVAGLSSPAAPEGTFVYTCKIAGSGKCHLSTFIEPLNGCGIASTGRFTTYGWGGAVYKYRGHKGKLLHVVTLPDGYSLGGKYGFCNLHNHGDFVWGGMRTYAHTKPAVAVEFDMRHNRISAMVGAHHLRTPVAAYYGNGDVP